MSWRACSTCKKPIALGARYYVCSVSTCQGRATHFAFCALDCWDAHVPTFRHKDAWAEERVAPTSAEPNQAPASAARADEDAILIVASKLKAYIHQRGGMNTSAAVLDVLSDRVRVWLDEAMARATAAGRKTLLDRDVL